MTTRTLLEQERALRFREEPIYRSPLRAPRFRNPDEMQVTRMNRHSAPNSIAMRSIRRTLAAKVTKQVMESGRMRHDISSYQPVQAFGSRRMPGGV